MNGNIHFQMKTMTDILTDSITSVLQKLTDGSSKTDKHDKQITDISFKLSHYEYRPDKMSIKNTHIRPFSLQITKLIDTSSKTENHEEQLT